MAERTVPGTDVALTIGGSDSSGGAGIQAGLKTFAVLGTYGASVITAITAQNTRGVTASEILDSELVEQQIEAVAGDLSVAATNVGMLGNAQVIKVVAASLRRQNLTPLVVDPVMVSKAGSPLLEDDAISVMAKELLPLATVVTPNGHEAAKLVGESTPITDLNGAQEAARQICRRFKVPACIVTGIHRKGDDEGEAVDVFFDGSEMLEVASAWRPTENTHGAGCTFSAAITAGLATGKELPEAVQQAKSVISEAIRQTTRLGNGDGPVNHIAYLDISG